MILGLVIGYSLGIGVDDGNVEGVTLTIMLGYLVGSKLGYVIGTSDGFMEGFQV